GVGLANECRGVRSTDFRGGLCGEVPGPVRGALAPLGGPARRSVKIWFTREEESLDSHNRSALTHYVKAGAQKNGALTAIEVRTFLNNGYWPYGGLGQNIAFAICTRPIDLYHRCPNVKWELFSFRPNH